MRRISSSEAPHAISLPITLRHINQGSEKWSKRKIVFALLLIASVLLLNVAVLIEASNQENQFTVDPFEQQLFPTGGKIIANVMCNYASSRGEIIEDYNSMLGTPIWL